MIAIIRFLIGFAVGLAINYLLVLFYGKPPTPLWYAFGGMGGILLTFFVWAILELPE